MKSNNQNKLKHLVSIREYLLTNINSNKNFNLRKLSKLLGRNDAYLQQYIKRGSPNYLPEEERIQLCHILKIEVNDLTPSWLRINDDLYSDSYKISTEKKCKDFGILIIVDEVKVGLGRSGLMHAFEHEGLSPDIVCFGKALGGGLPLSAVVGPADLMDFAPAFSIMNMLLPHLYSLFYRHIFLMLVKLNW